MPRGCPLRSRLWTRWCLRAPTATRCCPAARSRCAAFVTAIGETLRGGGRVLIPSFALGRAQEITQILQTAMAGGLLPTVPIHLDGLTRGITEAYEDMLPLLPEALQNRSKVSKQRPFLTGTVNLVRDRREREGILASERPAVVIASSGMLHAGASPQYARAWLPHAENALFVVGYQDAESPGKAPAGAAAGRRGDAARREG